MCRTALVRSVLIAAFVFALSGCGQSNRVSVEAFQKLEIGQEESQTTALLGPPAESIEEKGERVLTWVNGGLKVTARFREGKLTKRDAMLDGLPLVPEVEEPKATATATNPDDEKLPDGVEEFHEPKGRFKNVHERCRAFATKELSEYAMDGSWGFTAPNETAANGGMLIGLVVHLDRLAPQGEAVTGLQGVWLDDRGRTVRGKLLGNSGKRRVELVAKRGYAVTSIEMTRDSERVYGLSLDYMAVSGDRLDESRQDSSAYAGGKGPESKAYDRLVTARDYPIYGFECHFGRTLAERKWLDGIKIYIARALNER